MMMDDELYHYGVKGMKWGVRRERKKQGLLTQAQIKRYAKKGYAEDSYKSNQTVVGRMTDKITGTHKLAGKIKYEQSSNKQNEARAKKYLKDAPERRAEAVKKSAKTVATAITALTTAYAVDEIVNDGIVRNTLKSAGRAAVTSILKSTGSDYVRWYD